LPMLFEYNFIFLKDSTKYKSDNSEWKAYGKCKTCNSPTYRFGDKYRCNTYFNTSHPYF
jgi:predicted membrane-bound dolichyl-phosphate-mannose-protein mannosyltransferase